jgi:hypothetical protein
MKMKESRFETSKFHFHSFELGKTMFDKVITE